MRRNRIQILVAWVVLSTGAPRVQAAEFAGGTGEYGDPYQIATAEQLLSIGTLDRATSPVPGSWRRGPHLSWRGLLSSWSPW